MGPVENTNKELCGPVRFFRIYLRENEAGDHEEGPESKRQRTVAGLPVCSLLIPVDEILVSYVATDEIDDRPVFDLKTGERLSPHLLKGGR